MSLSASMWAVTTVVFGPLFNSGLVASVALGSIVLLAMAIAALLWLPHPLLGLQAVIGISLLAAQLPGDGGAAIGTKALLAGLVMGVMALVIESRTATGAGSLLHYGGVIAVIAAEVALFSGLRSEEVFDQTTSSGTAVAALLPIGLIALGLAIVSSRKSWALPGWITVYFACTGVLSVLGAPFGLQDQAVLAAFLVIGVAAYGVLHHHDTVRSVVLAELPDWLDPERFITESTWRISDLTVRSGR